MRTPQTDAVAEPRPYTVDPFAVDSQAPAAGLVVAGLRKRFPKADWQVLDGLDLTADPGTTVSIKGSNGAGKTTFLRVLAGLIKPDEGSIRLNDLDSERDARRYRTRVGLLSAGNTGLFARLSIMRHLEYWARLGYLAGDEKKAAIERTVESFALEEFAPRRADRLSMGQRQRARAAMTFLHDPKLVLLDEPTTSLDDEGGDLLRAAVRRVLALGSTVIWCTPAGVSEEGDFDKRYILEAGRLRAT